MPEKTNLYSTLSSSVHLIIGLGTLYILARALDQKLAKINKKEDSQETDANKESDAHIDLGNRESRRAKLFHNSEAKEPYYQKFNHSKFL